MLLHQPSPGIGFQPPAVLRFGELVNPIQHLDQLAGIPWVQTRGSRTAESGCVLGWKPPNVSVCHSCSSTSVYRAGLEIWRGQEVPLCKRWLFTLSSSFNLHQFI